MLKGEVAKFVERQIHVLSGQKGGVEVIEVNVQPDHVHLIGVWVTNAPYGVT